MARKCTFLLCMVRMYMYCGVFQLEDNTKKFSKDLEDLRQEKEELNKQIQKLNEGNWLYAHVSPDIPDLVTHVIDLCSFS